MILRPAMGQVSTVIFDICGFLPWGGSPTYGQWYGVILSAENKKQFFIPKNFAHGFLVLSDYVKSNSKVMVSPGVQVYSARKESSGRKSFPVSINTSAVSRLLLEASA